MRVYQESPKPKFISKPKIRFISFLIEIILNFICEYMKSINGYIINSIWIFLEVRLNCCRTMFCPFQVWIIKMCSAGNYLSPLCVIFVGKLIVEEEAKKFHDFFATWRFLNWTVPESFKSYLQHILLKSNFNIILPLVSLFWDVVTKIFVYFLSLPFMLHIPPISYPFIKPSGVTVNKSGGVFLCVDPNQHGILLPHPSGQIHPEACVWGTQSVWTATHQGQVLELRLLQVHLCVWSHKCAVHGWSGAVVFVVLRTRVSSPSSPTLQGSFWICE